MIPLSVDVPMRRLPWMNWALIVVTVVVSLAVPCERPAASPPRSGTDKPRTPEEMLADITSRQPEFSPLVLQRSKFAPHQLVTHLFQHADWLHLLGNMVFLFVFGNPINAKMGQIGFLAFYLGIGSCQGLIWLVIGSGGAEALVGASAAIMGLCGAFLVLYPLNDVTLLWTEFEWMFLWRDWTGQIPGWVLVLLFAAFDFWGAIFDRDSPVAYVCHLIGGMLGFLITLALVYNAWLTPDRGEQDLLMWLGGKAPAE
jgi:membrane associated rhomboid family serine protease